MMRSMFSAVTGLRNHQTRMDVIGNNIANVNTIGFKKSTVAFKDLLNQTIRGAAGPQGTRGGTNPAQIGLGMQIASVNTVFSSGSLQNTGRNFDLGIQGEGMFILKGDEVYYTRMGDFDFDTDGNLASLSTGLKVQGWTANADGVIESTAPGDMSGIQLTPDMKISPPKATENIRCYGNLNAAAAADETSEWTVPVSFYDTLGSKHEAVLNFTKSDANKWDVTVEIDGTLSTTDPAGPIPIEFGDGSDADHPIGKIVNGTTDAIDVEFTPAGSSAMEFTIDLSNLTQYAAEESTATGERENGYGLGELTSYSIDSGGKITGVYSNGMSRILAQVGMANFVNPAGLLKEGENLYVESNNSGEARIGVAGSGGNGTITPGALEMSNVDLSQEFTDMITTQRGFQANSRIISASDEMLQELANMKR